MKRAHLAILGALGVALSTLTLMSAPSSCAIADLPADEVCKDVGYSIANRVLSCTDDDTRSRQLYAAFNRDYSCRVFPANDDQIPNYYECPVAVREVPCDQVIAYGDDLDDWLAPLPYCARILERSDGSPLPLVADAGVDAASDAPDGDSP
jgi:hypothetical protein